jgi:prevent-host-death family protein
VDYERQTEEGLLALEKGDVMMTIAGKWKVQEAESRLSAVISAAEKHGPQSIVRRGRRVAVLVSVRDFKLLARQPKLSLTEFLAALPFGELDLERDRSPLRGDVEPRVRS